MKHISTVIFFCSCVLLLVSAQACGPTSATPTSTPQVTASASQQPVATNQPTSLPTSTFQPTATHQPIPTLQPTATRQPTSTSQPTPTLQPTATTPVSPPCSGWTIVSSPNAGTSLNGVVAVATNDAWAVGADGISTLVEHWNGSVWALVSSPTISGSTAFGLSGIAAVNSNDIWAVGSSSASSSVQSTLIEHWNGTAWNVVSSPNVAGLFNVLTAVSAISATDIWAVGNSSGNNGYQTLAEHWNGTAWSIVSSPSMGKFSSVDAVASNNVWAVGANPAKSQSLIEHWNGAAWSIIPSANPGIVSNTFNAIVALSASDIWAAGDYTNNPAPSAEFTPLIEHWNGALWSMVSSPLQGTSDLVSGMAAAASNNVWIVGDYRSSIDPYGPYFTLIEHWDGSKWSVENSPNPVSVSYGSDLQAATSIPGSDKIWTVGFNYIQGNTTQSLILTGC